MRGRWQKDGVQFMLRIFGHVAHVPEGLQQSADLLVLDPVGFLLFVISLRSASRSFVLLQP